MTAGQAPAVKQLTPRVRITGFLDFSHLPISQKIGNTTFWKLDLFPSSNVGKTPTQLGPLERANLNDSG
jgi:hypothetical protein